MTDKGPLPDEKIFRHSFYKAGNVVFEQGDTGTDIYILKRGAVTVYVDGRIMGLINTPNTFIGEMAFILGTPRTATIEAVEDSEFVVIPAEYLHDNVMRNPELGFELIKLLSSRLANTTRYASRLENEVTDMRNRLRDLQGLEEEEKEEGCKPPLEEELVRYGLITSEELESCRKEQDGKRAGADGGGLVNIMIRKGLLTVDELIQFLEMKQAY
ncbi:MAG: Crp/Fnr family transcriptional regulator [Spirochaetota bacterium]